MRKPWGNWGFLQAFWMRAKGYTEEKNWESTLICHLCHLGAVAAFLHCSSLRWQEDMRKSNWSVTLWPLGYQIVPLSYRPGGLRLGIDTPLPSAASPWPCKVENWPAGPPSVEAARMFTLTPHYNTLTRSNSTWLNYISPLHTGDRILYIQGKVTRKGRNA